MIITRNLSRGPLLLVAALSFIGSAAFAADSNEIRFDDEAWELVGDGTVVVDDESRRVLQIQSGRAIYRGADFGDGTIEFDFRHTEYRSFVYIQFRMSSDSEYEEIYFRPHKSRLPDAVQYTPIFRGSSQWQLFHDEHATAPAPFAANEWNRVRIVVKGDAAAVFVGDVEEPQLVIPRLAHGSERGAIALRAFEPRFGSDDRPPGLPTASFANLRITPTTDAFDFESASPEAPAKGVIRDWRLSNAFDPGKDNKVVKIPAGVEEGQWTGATTEPSGLVLLARDVAKPTDVRRASVLVRTEVVAAEARVQRFDFGYSDEVSVFLNGRLLFVGDDSYSFNRPRRQGLVSIDQGTLYLPLQAGANQLTLAVTDVFGGWGVIGQFVDE